MHLYHIVTRGQRAALAVVAVVVVSGCATLGALSLPPEALQQKYGTKEDAYLCISMAPEEVEKRYGASVDARLRNQGITITVRYRDQGQGDVVVLLHGVCSSLETWDGWVQRMRDSYRIVRLDIPGFGLTGPAPDRSYYKKEVAVDLLHVFVDHLGINEFSIVGSSLGGYIAWNYALKHPERIRNMILIDPVGYNQDMPFLISLASNPLITPLTRRMMPRFLLDIAVRQVYGDKSKVTPSIRQRYFDLAMRKGNKSSYVDVFVEMRTQNKIPGLSNGISEIKVPVMIMWGTKDEWIPYRYIENWKKDLPSARIISYEGVGHIPMEEIPERTAQDAMDFLRSPTHPYDTAIPSGSPNRGP